MINQIDSQTITKQKEFNFGTEENRFLTPKDLPEFVQFKNNLQNSRNIDRALKKDSNNHPNIPYWLHDK